MKFDSPVFWDNALDCALWLEQRERPITAVLFLFSMLKGTLLTHKARHLRRIPNLKCQTRPTRCLSPTLSREDEKSPGEPGLQRCGYKGVMPGAARPCIPQFPIAGSCDSGAEVIS